MSGKIAKITGYQQQNNRFNRINVLDLKKPIKVLHNYEVCRNLPRLPLEVKLSRSD